MKLYYFETPNAHLACATARYLDAPVEYVRVDLTKGEQRHADYLAINPNGKVPALVDGDLTLWEAPSIACHLACKAGSALYPTSERDRIDMLRWINWDTAHFSRHAGRIFFESFVKPSFGLGEPDQAELGDAGKFLQQFATVLNNHLRGREFLVGGRLSVADFAVGKFLTGAEKAAYPLQGYDELWRWYGQLQELPAWREPFPAHTPAATEA